MAQTSTPASDNQSPPLPAPAGNSTLTTPVWFLVIVLACLSFRVYAKLTQMAAPHGKGVAWIKPEDLDQTIKNATAQNAAAKDLVFYDFTADWCPPCQKRERTEFRSPKIIAEINAKFIPVRVDLTTRAQAESETAKKLTDKFNIYSIPRCVVTLSTGERVTDDNYMYDTDYFEFLQGAEKSAKKVHAEIDLSKGDYAGAISKLDPSLITGSSMGSRGGLNEYLMAHHLLVVLKRQADADKMMQKTLQLTKESQKINGGDESSEVKNLVALNGYLQGQTAEQKLLDSARYDSERAVFYLAIALKELRQEQKVKAIKELHQAALYGAKSYESDRLAEYLLREME
jgi:thiol-disulfide isomerase/thioredoxin